jgi:Ca2+-binding RTX toxin-like protein
MPIRFDGPEFRVDSTWGDNISPSLVTLADGRFVAIWHVNRLEESGFDVAARIFKPNGQAEGDDFIVNSTTDEGQEWTSISALPNGGFVATWKSRDTDDGTSDCIRARVFGADGQPSGNDFVVNAPVNDMQFVPSITALPGGRFVVTWLSSGNGFPIDSIRAAIFDSAGDPIGDEFFVTTLGAPLGGTSVTALSDGRFVVTWDSESGLGDGEYNEIHGRIFDADGQPSGAEFVLNTTGSGFQDYSSITSLPNGGFVVVWRSDENPGQAGTDTDVRGRVFDADGQPLGPDFLLSTTTTDDQADPSVVALPDGRFVAAWYSGDNGDGSGSCVRARVFNFDGTSAGDDFVVNTIADSSQGTPTVTALADGRFVVAWSTWTGLDNDLRAQIFDSTVFDGTGSADSWNGSNVFADKISGAAGDDTLSGFGGNDTIGGGDGNDTLTGGSGSDYLSGGAGNDTVSYSLAAAAVKANFVDPSLNAGEAKGDTFNSIENLEGSAFNDTLDGNAGANILSGLNGSDLLRGAAGTDTLLGGAGDDTLGGGDGNDILTGGLGADYLSGGTGIDTATYAQATAAVKVNLADPSLNAGEAKGDTFNSIENLEGSAFNDTFDGNAGANTLNGNDGLDLLRGAAGNDILKGGAGGDTLGGGDGNDLLIGGEGEDHLSGGNGVDTASYAEAQAGVIVNLAASDRNAGEAAGDIFGSVENLVGSKFNDLLTGNGVANLIQGGTGDDTINGRGGNDTLTGHSGKNIFVFDTALSATGNVDTITDFSRVDDTIQLDNTIFTKLLATGALASGYFRANATGAAQDKNDHILYETDTGKLFYDADGNGAGLAVHFATLTGNPTITAADFLVI